VVYSRGLRPRRARGFADSERFARRPLGSARRLCAASGRLTAIDGFSPAGKLRRMATDRLQTSACMVEIEEVCGKLGLHRQCAGSRSPDIGGLKRPT
jgi:hypothetical protein